MGGSTTSMSSMLGDGSVQLRLIGDDLPKMQEAAKDIAANMEELDSVSESDSGMGATSPEIKVTVDRAKAAAKGLTVAQVFQQVAAAVSAARRGRKEYRRCDRQGRFEQDDLRHSRQH